MEQHLVTELTLHQKSKCLEVHFDDLKHFTLSCEYLRVFSPSAEVQGHGGEKPKPVTGKEDVNIIGIDPVGHYGVKLIFDDGHDSGIYSWDILYQLGVAYQENWANYLKEKEKYHDIE